VTKAFTLSPPNEVRDSEGEAVALPKVKVVDASSLIIQLFSRMLSVKNNLFRYCT
jgi:hypothetical protein